MELRKWGWISRRTGISVPYPLPHGLTCGTLGPFQVHHWRSKDAHHCYLFLSSCLVIFFTLFIFIIFILFNLISSLFSSSSSLPSSVSSSSSSSSSLVLVLRPIHCLSTRTHFLQDRQSFVCVSGLVHDHRSGNKPQHNEFEPVSYRFNF